jgi:hypothetical protein
MKTKEFLKTVSYVLPQNLQDILRCKSFRDKRVLRNWKRNDCPIPPPHIVKQKAIQEYKKYNNADVLVETGTCFGTMVAA